jgi:hypothetical protein
MCRPIEATAIGNFVTSPAAGSRTAAMGPATGAVGPAVAGPTAAVGVASTPAVGPAASTALGCHRHGHRAPGLTLELSDVDLAAISDAQRERAAMLSPDLTITRTGEPTLPVHADAHRIDQILGNLIDNARRHTAPGGHIVIDVRTTDHQMPGRATPHAELTVTDTGPGHPRRRPRPHLRQAGATGHSPQPRSERGRAGPSHRPGAGARPRRRAGVCSPRGRRAIPAGPARRGCGQLSGRWPP